MDYSRLQTNNRMFGFPKALFLLNVFPVPGLIKVRPKPEAFSIAHDPLVDGCLNLNGAI